MRLRAIAIGTLVATTGISAVIWSGRYAPWTERRQSTPDPVVLRAQEKKAGEARWTGQASGTSESGTEDPDPAVDARPKLAEGLIPTAVAAEPSYDFGRMRLGERKSHSFRIENKGPGPLVLAKGPTECKCTVSSLSGREVPPGGFADVEIAWAPLEADPKFEKSAIVWTNDPRLPEIRLRIAGNVGRAVTVSPAIWHAGTVAEDREGKAVGIIASDLEHDFKILSVTSIDPNVTVSYKPMSTKALTRVGMLSGYEFTAAVGNKIPIGSFRSRLKILTTLEPKTLLDVELTAVRRGPIRILAAGNVHWDSEKALLNLGRFRHETGFKTTLPAYVYNMRGPFRVLGVRSTDNFVKVTLEPNPAGGSGEQQLVRFVFEVQPGSPAVNYFTQKPAHITVDTNHPKLKRIDFDLQFVSM